MRRVHQVFTLSEVIDEASEHSEAGVLRNLVNAHAYGTDESQRRDWEWVRLSIEVVHDDQVTEQEVASSAGREVIRERHTRSKTSITSTSSYVTGLLHGALAIAALTLVVALLHQGAP